MTATRQDVKIIAGDSRILAFGPVKNEDGSYADLLGATAVWSAARKSTSTGSDIFVQKTTNPGGGILITSQQIGDDIGFTVEVVLTGLDTITIPAVQSQYQHWYHELQITDVTGGIFTVSTGKLDVFPGLIPPPAQPITAVLFADSDTPRTAVIAQV